MSDETELMTEIKMAEGDVAYFRPDQIDDILNQGVETMDGQSYCPLCRTTVQKVGFGPHARSHRQAAGLVEPRRRPNRKKGATSKPKSQPKLSVEDACLGLLMGVTNRETIPIKHIGTVTAWIAETEKLLKEIKS